MADTAIEALTQLSIPDTGGGDRMVVVDDPTGSPISKYITTRDVLKATITRDIYISADRFIPTTTNGTGALTDRELVTNDVMVRTANFDATTSQSVQFWHTFEEGWNAGTVTFKAITTNQSGLAAETIKLDLAGRSYADSDVIDQTFGTLQQVADTFTTQNDINISPFSSAITIGGTPADAQPIVFKLSRDISDTMTGDVEVIGITIRYTVTDLASS